jgi:hypothetical protein
MSLRGIVLLGLFLVVASFVHGGIYSAGHDFVLNRFTGWYEFVPAEGDDEEEAGTQIFAPIGSPRALTCTGPGARVARLGRVRAGNRARR